MLVAYLFRSLVLIDGGYRAVAIEQVAVPHQLVRLPTRGQASAIPFERTISFGCCSPRRGWTDERPLTPADRAPCRVTTGHRFSAASAAASLTV
jgi:hypothetical protein